MVIPRSRSRSMLSRNWSCMSRLATVPVSCSKRSARVDLPWSMWAMMQKLRIRETGASVMQRRNPVSGPESVVATILRSGTSGHEQSLDPAAAGDQR